MKGYCKVANGSASEFSLSLQPLCNYNTYGADTNNALMNGEVLITYWTIFDLFHIPNYDPHKAYREHGVYSFNKLIKSLCCSSQYAVDQCIKALKAHGLLKTVRYPAGDENKFMTEYELNAVSADPETVVDSIINLSAAAGRKRAAKGRIVTAPIAPQKYIKLSRNVLHCKNLTLRAKFIYALIVRATLLAQGNKDFTLTKELLQMWSGYRKRKFDAAWNELKSKGYLLVKQIHTNKIEWEYEFYEEPNEEAINYFLEFRTKKQEQYHSILRYKADIKVNSKKNNKIKEKQTLNIDEIRRKIGYDDLISDGLKGTFTVDPEKFNGVPAIGEQTIYAAEADRYIALLRNVFTSGRSSYNIDGERVSLHKIQEVFKMIDQDDFKEFVIKIRQLEDVTEIQHPTAYKIAVLYSIIENNHSTK